MTTTPNSNTSNVVEVTVVDELPPVKQGGRPPRDFSQFLAHPGKWCKVNRTYAAGSTHLAKTFVEQGTRLHGGNWEGTSRTEDGKTTIFVRYTPGKTVESKSKTAPAKK
jgi:hypothetical protein